MIERAIPYIIRLKMYPHYVPHNVPRWGTWGKTVIVPHPSNPNDDSSWEQSCYNNDNDSLCCIISTCTMVVVIYLIADSSLFLNGIDNV